MNADPRIDALLTLWREEKKRRATLTPEDLCRNHPELLEEVRRRLELGPGHANHDAPTAPRLVESENLDANVPGYEILEELGRGGMGVVYKAKQAALNRLVALKMILSGSRAGSEERARFLAEAEAVAALDHPGIVRVFDFGTHQGHCYCALEFCEGGSLAKRLGVPLQAQEAARIVEQLASAVQVAHQKKIVHRDLKPANVLAAADGTYKVADFGLVKRMEDSASGLTRTGAIMGSPAYMSPEQARGSKEVGPATDVYSLGAILYECLTGRPPFLAATEFDTLAQVINDEPVPPRTTQKTIPRDLETICLKCLRKDPAKRYAGAAELAEDLRRWRAGEPIVARPVGQIERAWKAVRRRPGISALVAVVLLALVGGTVVSTLFALRADEREKAAKAALAEVEETLAVGLLRPVGRGGEADRVALEELASLQPRHDRVRLLFFEKALEQPNTARQLVQDPDKVVVAAVGMRSDLRQDVLRLAWQRLRDPTADRFVRLICARLLLALEDDEPERALTARSRIAEEVEGMWTGTVTSDDDRAIIQSAYGDLTSGSRLPREEADRLSARLVAAALAKPRLSECRDMVSTHPLLARLLPGEVAQDRSRQLAEHVCSFAEKAETASDFSSAVTLLVDLVPYLSRRQAEGLMRRLTVRLVSFTEGRKKGADEYYLPSAFYAIAPYLGEQQASGLALRLLEWIRRTGEEADFGQAFNLLWRWLPTEVAGRLGHELVVKALAAAKPDRAPTNFLANCLSQEQAVELADRLTNEASATDDLGSMMSLVFCFSSLAGSMPPEPARKRASQIAAKTMTLRADGSLWFLANVIARLLRYLPEEEARKLASNLLRQIIQHNQTVRDQKRAGKHDVSIPSAVQLGIIREFVPFLPPFDASPLIEQCLHDSLEAELSDTSLSLQAFAALAGRLSPQQKTRLAKWVCSQIEPAARAEGSKAGTAYSALTIAFLALADFVEPARKEEVARRLLFGVGIWATYSSLSFDDLAPAHYVCAVVGGRSANPLTSLVLVGSAAILHNREENDKADEHRPSVRLSSYVPLADLVEVMKHPDVVGSDRAVLRQQVAKRTGAPSSWRSSHWALVRHLEKARPDLVRAPVRRRTELLPPSLDRPRAPE